MSPNRFEPDPLPPPVRRQAHDSLDIAPATVSTVAARESRPARDSASQQSAVNFAFAALKIQLEHHLGILFSPHSLYQALAVPAVEVLPKFRDAFLSTLRFPDPNLSIDDFAETVRDVASTFKSFNTFVVRDVNNVWINTASNISENRFDTSRSFLSVGVSTVMFPDPAIGIINRHIANATDGMIPAALSPDSITADTAFLITNALCFHGQWATPFDPRLTRLEPFTRFDGSTIKTQFMRAKLTVRYAKNHLARIVFLPYKDSSCEFVAVLPADKTEAGFRQALMAFDPSWFDSRRRTREVVLRLPKFRMMGRTRRLNALANQLGLKEVFETQECIFPQLEGETRLQMVQINHGTKSEKLSSCAKKNCGTKASDKLARFRHMDFRTCHLAIETTCNSLLRTCIEGGPRQKRDQWAFHWLKNSVVHPTRIGMCTHYSLRVNGGGARSASLVLECWICIDGSVT
jgi:serine protease inhibitor